MSSKGARIAAASISVILVLVVGVTGMAGTDVTSTDTDLMSTATDDPTDLPTDLPSSSPTLPDLPEVTLEKAVSLSGGVKPPEDEPDTGLMFTAHYPKGELLELDGAKFRAITLDILPTGTVVTRSAVAVQGEGVVTRNAIGASTSGAAAEPPCSDKHFEQLGVAWKAGSMPLKWRLDKRSIPARLPARKVKRKVRKGLAAWARPTTNCSTDESISFGFRFKGRTRKDPAKDGVNVVDFGPLDGNAVGLTYSWYVGSEIVDFDIRMNSRDHKWAVRKRARRRFQVQNLVAHEAGHALGLGDLGDPHGKLTMFGIVLRGELKKTTLGRGDLLGAEAQSP